MTDETSLALDDRALASTTFWESAAETRWGRYVSQIEEGVLRAAAAAIPHAGKGLKGLEVGCEGGRWCRLLIGLGWDMTATDIDASVLQLCQAKSPSLHCLLVDKDDESIPADNASLDLLVCFEVPPVINSKWFPHEAARVIRQGGQLVGSLNNLLSWRGTTNRIVTSLRGWQPFYAKRYSSFRRGLEDCGFRIDEARGCCWPPYGRHSNSPTIRVATFLEQRLGFCRWTSVSPWVVFRATRQ